MSDTFIKIVQNIKNNVKGTVLGAKIEHLAGNLVEVKIFSLGQDAGQRAALWNRLIKVTARRPYKSLESYAIKDSKSFYGRDKVILEVLSRLFSEDRRLLLVFGAPGVGKTSMIDAGVAPLIIQQGGLLVSISNYDNPAESIQQALTGLTSDFKEEEAGEAAGEEVSDDTKSTDDGKSALREVIEGKVKPGSLLLVLDQFELLFERSITKDQRRAFFTDLTDLFDAFPKDPPRVIIVARDEPEVKAGLAELQRHCPGLFDAIVKVPLLDLADARSAISSPLVDSDDRVQFESDELVELIADNLTSLGSNGTEVYPPHLQIVCCSLYDEALKKRPSNITRDLLTRAKFSQGIVARFLELRLDNQLSNVKAEAFELLIQLAAPKHTRWVSPSALTLKPDPTKPTVPSVETVLEQMVAAKLLYRHYINEEVHYGFIDAGMVDRVMMLADDETVEQQRAGEEMKRMWQAWLARDVFATSEQLDYISRNQARLEFEPVQILFLLRSAIERQKETGEWLKLLGIGKAPKLISELDKVTESEHAPGADIATLEFATELLSSAKAPANDSSNGTSPARFTSLAQSAAKGPDDVTRTTAALALMSQGVGAAVGRIDDAIGDIDNWSKRINLVKLRSAMVEADESMKSSNSKLHYLDHKLVFIWLVFKRAYYHDAARILRITASGALCSGLLVAAWAGLFSLGMTGSGSSEFQIGFTTGAFLGGGMALGLALIKPLIQANKLTGQFTASPAKAALIICTIIFGSLHWAVQFLSGPNLPTWNSTFVMIMGFLFGGGIGLGVMTDFDQEGTAKPRWQWRYIALAVLIFLLIPLVFIIAKTSIEPLNLAIVSGARHFASTLFGLSKLIDSVFYDNQTKYLLRTGSPLVYHLVSAVDTAVNGLLLIIGFKLGVRLSHKL